MDTSTQQIPKQVTTPLPELKSYLCTLDGDHWTLFNALSPGMAKSEYLRYLDIDGITYTMIRCRLNGPVYTSQEFKTMARYRNIDFAYCGMAVKVGDWPGVIVGHNSDANLDVFITDGRYKKQVVNCHPHSDVTYFDKNGNVLKQFGR